MDEGIISTDKFLIVPKAVSNGIYARFMYLKSSSSTTYKRTFNKIDEFFSYVGGLIGTILGFMVFMDKFSLMAF